MSYPATRMPSWSPSPRPNGTCTSPRGPSTDGYATGFIVDEQLTPGAPWRIRLSDGLKARFNAEAAEGFLPMREAIRALGVSRQTVLQRVKRGELEAVHVTRGRQKGLRIKVLARQTELFEAAS